MRFKKKVRKEEKNIDVNNINMNQLLEAKDLGYKFHESPVNTVYLEKNKSSYFKAIRDSLEIYLPIIKFSMVSIISALIDLILLILIDIITSNLLISVFVSRILSATFNYIGNKEYGFSRSKNSVIQGSAIKYILLALTIVLLNYQIMRIYIFIGLSLLISKICTEGTLFFFSYWVQRRYIFRQL